MQPVLIGLAVLAGIAAFAALVWFIGKGRIDTDARRVQLDAQTHCIVGAPPPETLFVLADQSDHIPAVEMSNLYDDVLARARELPAASLVDVLVVSGNDDEPPRSIFHACTPVDLSPLSENEKMQRQVLGGRPDRRPEVWEDQFGQPLRHALDTLEQQPPSDTALITAFVQLGRMGQFRDTQVKRILVFSDMLENSRFIRQGNPYPTEAELEQRFGQLSVRAALKDATIDVAYVPRPRYATQQTVAHQQWWRDYFRIAEAGAVTFDPEIAQ